MTDISDDQVDELLRKAEQRLEQDVAPPAVIARVAGVKLDDEPAATAITTNTNPNTKEKLSVRAARPLAESKASSKVSKQHSLFTRVFPPPFPISDSNRFGDDNEPLAAP